MSLAAAWPMHQIVPGVAGRGNPDGADGVDIADINGDGRPDIVSGHEQGWKISVSLNPEPAGIRFPWPTVLLSAAQCSYEDAVFGDVDGDGAIDVVATCELVAAGGTVQIFFAPTDPHQLLTPSAWTVVNIAAATAHSMRAAIADVAGDAANEIVVGEKEATSAVGLAYYSSATPRIGASWIRTQIVPVAWVMQMVVQDLDDDGDMDIVYSDREKIHFPTTDNSRRGLRWLESSGGATPTWTEHPISAVEGQHKWFDLRDWDGDGDLDIIDCRSDVGIADDHVWLNGGSFASFTDVATTHPAGVGLCQHATAVDVDCDGILDLAFSHSDAPNLSGVVWQKVGGTPVSPTLTRGEISGILDPDSDVKFDNLAWVDIDGDGDMDAITSEQHVASGKGPGLGVVYFENPHNTFVPPAGAPSWTFSAADAGAVSVQVRAP